MAASVARIMPLPYSPVMASTPSRPIAIWDRCRPPRLIRTESMVAFWCTLRWPGSRAPSSAAMIDVEGHGGDQRPGVERTVAEFAGLGPQDVGEQRRQARRGP